jgi:signal transduction histidine kinase/DNA-binding response OmpR family regulator
MSFLKKTVRFNGFRFQSIKAKFLSIVLPSAVISFLIVSVCAGLLSYHDMKDDILTHAALNAKSYARPLGLSLWNLNTGVIDSQIQAMLSDPDICGVKVVERLGDRIFTAGELPQQGRKEYLESSIQITHVVFDAPEVLGTLYLYSKKVRIYQELLKRFLRDGLLFLILVLTVIVSAMVANHKIIMVPMHKLIESIRQYNRHQELKPAAWTADDEIGQIIAAYNGLIVSVDMGNTRIRSALETAREANKVKGEFLANMSHEIRTPLNGIMGMADLLLQTGLSGERQHLASTIYSESELLLGIINDILDFSKIEAGKLELEQIAFDLRNTLENLCAAMAVNADKKGIELVHYLDPAAPTRLIGDPGRLRQVFVNLIGNAIKFTHKGEVLVKGELIHKFEQKAAFRFSVEDTGVGISAEKQEMIFDSFSQADGSTTRKYGGTGLGITIAKMLVEKMGGRIALDSEPDKGTRFWFEVELFRQPPQTRPHQTGDVQFSDLCVFLVDDVETSRDSIARYLSSWGCGKVLPATGEQALEQLESLEQKGDRIDLILIDYSMPEMNDFKLARDIRQLTAHHKTPLIVLTAMGKIGDATQCRSAGVNGYLTKPVRSRELKTFIRRLIGDGSGDDTEKPRLMTRYTLAEERRENITVLLVEDYITNQQVALKQLENAGFKVLVANNGKEAVQLFETHEVDVVLMDIQMPVMDGYEATRLIRSLEKDEQHTPVIAMTAHAVQGYREKCLQAGMDDYITKPLKRTVLISTVTRWIQERPEPGTYNYYVRHTPGTAQEPVLDVETGVAEFDGDRAFFITVLDEFLATVETQMEKIHTALADERFTELSKQAHAIKGGAANLTAAALSAAAARLEKKAVQKDLKGLDSDISALAKQYENLKAFRAGADFSDREIPES